MPTIPFEQTPALEGFANQVPTDSAIKAIEPTTDSVNNMSDASGVTDCRATLDGCSCTNRGQPARKKIVTLGLVKFMMMWCLYSVVSFASFVGASKLAVTAVRVIHTGMLRMAKRRANS